MRAHAGTITDVPGLKVGHHTLATRPTVVRLPTGKIVSITRLFDDSTAVRQVPVPPSTGATRRLSWRELATEQ